MSTFTSTLPNNLLELLNRKAKELNLPKNKLLERALQIYLTQLNKAEYIRSYKKMAQDTYILNLAELGMVDYLSQLKETEID